ncbi:arylsulfatase I-like [Anthonomus grandis grandis]|uniref:arylsulfatase I-like n=1 Tax=Anthonomus grandis grandis TaxID=2921223 RepID=UPI0021665850|nr:arylsulfatase I-like [Anthonomus grandis grandis]
MYQSWFCEKMKCLILLSCLVAYSHGITEKQSKKPHIIVIVADDMGFNDVSFHGSDEIPTPNIDALAYNGVILNSHYTQALCTPSRASFLTGKYPIHLGMQHLVILEPEPWGLPLNETLLPEHLKKNGYTTRAIGKWHLGFYKKEYTPTYRGFDSHYGYWQGYQDYYEHTVHATYSEEMGYDFRNNMTVDYSVKGKYTTTLLTEEAVKTIREHNTDDPMFMYLAHLAPHAGNDWYPLQAPDDEIAKFAHIQDPERRIYAAMVSMLDKSVGSVVAALREKHMLENSIVIFMSDNGAAPEGVHANHGSNYPFRGMKASAWEGAMRNIAAVWSPLIKKPKRVSNNLMHISDWLPTLFSAAGLDHSQLSKALDGKDQWKSISEDQPSSRIEILHNIDNIMKYAAIRQGPWKYVYGSAHKMEKDNWYGNNGKDPLYKYDEESVLHSKVGNALSGFVTYQQIQEKNKNIHFSSKLLNINDIKRLRENATIKCKELTPEDQLESSQCNPMISPCLFNIKDDPCERVNLASQRPLILITLEQEIIKYTKTARKPINMPRDPNANPDNFNGTWTNWGDPEVIVSKKISPKPLSHLAIGLISGACVAVLLIIIILLAVTCKKPLKQSCSNLYTLDSKCLENSENSEHLFEDREKHLRSCTKDEFRVV